MFLSNIRAEDRSPFGSFWFSPIAMHTASGARVSADSAMTLSAVFRAVALVSGHMALLPLVFYKRGTRKRLNHPLWTILNRRPNRWQNAFEWREMLQGHLELRGNCYNEIFADGRGKIVELVPRHPDSVKLVPLAGGDDYRYQITNPDGSTRTVARGAIWHIRGMSSNGMVGMSTIEYARESFGLSLAAQSYGARFFANDARPGGWMEYPGTYKDKTQRESIRESMQEAQSGANRGKIMLLDHGMKYHEVGLTNEDAQFLETRQFQITEIARWFGIPPHKIGDLAKSTNNNIEQQALEYVTDGLLTRAHRWEASIGAELLFDDEEIDVEYDFAELLRGDSTARAAYYHSGILDSWMVPNEARERENMEPIQGADKRLIPLNMIEQGAQQNVIPAADAASQRVQSMVRANAERLGRRIAKSKSVASEDAAIISQALAVPLASAEAWCADQVGFDQQTLTDSLIKLGDAT